jgi:cytochrome P450
MVLLRTAADWLSPAFLADPYPHYRALRESDPVHRDEDGRWIITRHDDVTAILRDDAKFSAQQDNTGSMLVSDPPKHTRLRSIVSKAFTPRAVEALAPRIEEIVAGLLDEIEGSGDRDVELIARFAYPLPITVIAEMLGVEKEHRDLFRENGQIVALMLGPIADPHISAQAATARNQLFHYFEDLIARRRAQPQDDLVSAMIAAEDAGDRLSHAELLSMLFLLLVGGHETTVNLVANSTLAMIRNPEQRSAFASGDVDPAIAVEEFLRYDPPVHYTGRIAANDVAMRGRTIRRGEPVRLILAAANRDPEAFADPDRLDLRRDPNPHLAFGWGTHFCLGAPLARLEARIALPALLRRFSNPQLIEGTKLRYRSGAVLRGLEELPLRLGG